MPFVLQARLILAPFVFMLLSSISCLASANEPTDDTETPAERSASIVTIDIEIEDVIMASKTAQDVLTRIDGILKRIEEEPNAVSAENLAALTELSNSIDSLADKSTEIMNQVPQSIAQSEGAVLDMANKAYLDARTTLIDPTTQELKELMYIALAIVCLILIGMIGALIYVATRLSAMGVAFKKVTEDYRIVHVSDQKSQDDNAPA